MRALYGSTTGMFVKSTGFLFCVRKASGSFTIDDLPLKVETMIIWSIKAFLKSVDEIGKTQTFFSDVHVFCHIHTKISFSGNMTNEISVENACASHANECGVTTKQLRACRRSMEEHVEATDSFGTLSSSRDQSAITVRQMFRQWELSSNHKCRGDYWSISC